MSNPCSIGRNKAGVSTVLSMIAGSPWLWATRSWLAIVGHVVLRVARRLQVNGAGVRVHELVEGFRLGGIEEAHFDAEFGERLAEQGPRAAVEAVGGDEVLPGVDDRQERRGDRPPGRWRRPSPPPRRPAPPDASPGRRWWGSSSGCRCCRTRAGRRGSPRGRCRGRRSWSWRR